MIEVNTLDKYIKITLKNGGCIEDFICILLKNGYWVKTEYYGNKVHIYIKED